MHKYEIMLIVDPKFDLSNLEKMVKEIFSKDLKKFEKMKNTEFAYPINGQNNGIYLLILVDTDPSNIIEFKRRILIEKSVWRHLIINLDSEKITIKPKKRFNYNKDREKSKEKETRNINNRDKESKEKKTRNISNRDKETKEKE